MKVAIGLPNAVLGAEGPEQVEWARRAEEAGFSSLGTIGRIVFGSLEELVALAACAGATERIGLATTVLIGPAREPVLLAKQAATLDAISGGRLALGLGVGWREDDFRATGHDFAARGRALDAQVARLRALWAGEPAGDGLGPVGPRPARSGGPEIWIGGNAPPALRRVGRLADAYMGPPFDPKLVRDLHVEVGRAARDAGRAVPRLVGACYVALGEDVRERAEASMSAYYEAGGEAFRRQAVEGLLTDAEAVRERLRGLEAAGADEVFLWPAVPDLSQVERIAEAAGLRAPA